MAEKSEKSRPTKTSKKGSRTAPEPALFETLRAEHESIADILRELRADDGIEVAEQRAELLPILAEDLLAHARAEDVEVYAVLRGDPVTAAMIESSRAEHAELERVLSELLAVAPDSSDWRPLFDELSQRIERHVAREERELFPRAKQVLSHQALGGMNERYLERRALLEEARIGAAGGALGDEPELGAADPFRP